MSQQCERYVASSGRRCEKPAKWKIIGFLGAEMHYCGVHARDWREREPGRVFALTSSDKESRVGPKPRLVQVTDEAEMDYILNHRDRLEVPYPFYRNHELWVEAEQLRIWRSQWRASQSTSATGQS